MSLDSVASPLSLFFCVCWRLDQGAVAVLWVWVGLGWVGWGWAAVNGFSMTDADDDDDSAGVCERDEVCLEAFRSFSVRPNGCVCIAGEGCWAASHANNSPFGRVRQKLLPTTNPVGSAEREKRRKLFASPPSLCFSFLSSSVWPRP